MKDFRNLLLVLVVCGISGIAAWAQSSAAQQGQPKAAADGEEAGVPVVVEGLVRDIACPIQNHKSTATQFNLDCAQMCAKTGSPLIILSNKGEIYLPISDQMPDPSQREKLLPYVGKYVRATGTAYQLKGTRAIVIKEIAELKDVKLNTKLGTD
jgi:hypothetical protein